MKRTADISHTYIIILLLATAMLLLGSCKSTKFVGDDEYLLVKNKISCDEKSIDEDELMLTLSQKSNKKILGLVPFNLYVYNFMKSGKERNWKNKLANSIGEEPVIYANEAKLKSIENLKSYMASQSYYRANISVNERFSNKKKAKVKYTIESGPSYKIASIDYNINNESIKELFFSDTINSLIKRGHSFNTDTLKAERERIARFFKLNGYYYFSVNNVHFFADTLRGDCTADITISLQNTDDATDAFQSQTIRTVNIYTNYDLTKKNDTVGKKTNMFVKDGIKFTYDGKMTHRTSVLLQSCFFKPDEKYSIQNVEDTYSHLSSLKQFRLINIKLVPPSVEETLLESISKRYLDANIYLAPMKRQSFNVELEGSNTSGNIGMSGVLSYKNRNIFRGAQIFSAKANISFQTSALLDTTTNEEIKSKFFNTLEYGGEIKIIFPKLLLPFFNNIEFIKRHDPKTQLSLSYNYQNRPDYTRTIANINFGYSWIDYKNKNITHYINPIELYWVKILDFSEDFRRRIQNLYIKYSYEDQFLWVFSYDMVFNNQNVNKNRNWSYFWLNLETCGNLLDGIYAASGIQKDEESYKFLGVEFAQYVKADLDYRFYNIIDEKNSIVYRAFFGIGLAYGNSKTGMPFVKRYFIGGANDIRAWQVRTIGPGSYSNIYRNYDQIADMKLMFNMEYRFPIFSIIQGALFVDAGNIWAIDKNDNRGGALFRFTEFYKQIALGTGFGFRFDLKFLVLRFDIGIPVYNPSISDDPQWFESFRPFKINKFTLNFGIGYPF
jgi:outer membrane protein assembly factor BamA